MILSKAKRILFVIVFLFVIFLFAEISARIVYFIKYHKIEYLITPFNNIIKREIPKPQVVYELKMDDVRDAMGKVLYRKYSPGIYTYKPNYNGKEQVISFYINKDGFRNREIKNPKDRYRIICLGGSGTAGLESPDEQTWPAFLEQFLSRERVEVINMGITSFDSKHIYNLLRLEVGKYHPDMVIFHMGRNDMHHYFQAVSLDSWYKELFYTIHKNIYYRIMSYTFVVEKIGSLLYANSDPFMFYHHDPFPFFLGNFKKILEFCKGKKLNMAFVCEVKNCHGSPQQGIDLIKAVSESKDYEEVNRSTSADSFIVRLYRLQEIVRELLKDYTNAQFIDPRLEFYEAMLNCKEDLFSENNTDPLHLTPAGNKILAEIIAKKLRIP